MNLYPNSLIRLVVIGNILTLLPLMLAVGYAAITVERISAQSEMVAGEANRAGRLSWALPEDLRHMERTLRQYSLLHDRSLLDDYSAARDEWRRSMRMLAGIPLMASLSDRLNKMVTAEETAYRRFQADDNELTVLQDTLVSLLTESEVAAEEAGTIVDSARTSFRYSADVLRQRLMVGIAIAVGLALLLLLFGRRLMARLLSRVERAVLALGEGHLERKIRLKGPEDVQRIGERLEWLRCRLHELEEQRTRVLRHVSHELKTPLAALREGSSLLSDQVAGALTEQQRRIVGIMHNNALRLQTLIDGLLRLQRAEHALERVERIPMRFDEVIQQVLATHELAARDKRLRLSGTLAPLTVTGGREELTTIVNNIVANAIKYSPAGGTIHLSLTRDGGLAVFDVFDQGPGVPAEARERIFEPFYRAPGTRRSTAGTGLGLAIAREFVHALHGSVELMEAAAGSHFRVAIPLCKENA
jgi:two-component system, NtrC family, sensor histidine kinase GlrK